MKNFIQPGETVSVTAPATVASGAGVAVGNLFGVAVHDAASGDPVEISTLGVFDLPKPNTQVWAAGDPLYWNGGQASKTAGTGNIFIGVALEPAANPSAIGRVRLNGVAPVALTS